MEDCLIYKSKRADSISVQDDKPEQCSRRTCLLLHGIREH